MSEQKIAYYLSFGDVIRILRLVDEIPFQELQVELGDLKLHVVQDKEILPAQHAESKVSVPESSHVSVPESSHSPRSEAVREPVAAAPLLGAGAEKDGTPVLAPLAGTFYRAPSPGAPPFVEVGTAVKAGDIVGILEIMKLMNHVTAPCSGVISRICARNEEFVEFGTVLAVIDPERVG